MQDFPYRKCVAVLVLNGSMVFVGKRVDVDEAWQLPQGGVDDDENYLDAAKRELFEETGISTVEPLGSTGIHRYDYPLYVQRIIQKRRNRLEYIGQEVFFWAFRFLGNEEEIDIQKEPREFMEWKWLSIPELIRCIVPFKRRAYRNAISDFYRKNILS
ncbi:MAG: RNA pyrophosphohydrolase [Holosporaceae bacterium]|nr:RNA pyrophosphohydrolase [Holosporaceae bacterium]